jgi:glucose/arabinose dehydrogenase
MIGAAAGDAVADGRVPGRSQMTSHTTRRGRLGWIGPAASALAAVALLLGVVLPAPAQAAITIGFTTVASGLSRPVALTNAGDGSGRLFVVEQAGRIRVITKSGALRATPFLDIRGRVSCCGERGMLGLAFHPSYETNRRFYVAYTDSDGALVVGEYRRTSTDRNRASTTERRIIRIPHPGHANHNGGQLAFGPDGYLYIGTGDGGGSGDPDGSAQDLSSLLGKVLRIKPNVAGSTPAYTTAGNPFVGTAGRDEIWSYGLRNPWRFSFDRSTGSLWIGDVGQNKYEEIDRALRSAGGGRGVNFGWNMYEARSCFNGPCSPSGKQFPIAYYAHGAKGCSVIGGYVYRGSRWPSLVGKYLFGDYCSGKIWYVNAGGAATQDERLLVDTSMMISAFGEGQNGALYVLDYGNGRVRRIVVR